MKVRKKILDDLLRSASFQNNGDDYERKFGGLVVQSFPNCELFWKLFVVPFTERVSDYPNGLVFNIRPRHGVDPELENIANINYTTFLNLVYAHNHLNVDIISSLEDFYSHLGSVCDLAESFLEKWFFLLNRCRGVESEILQQLSRNDFLNIAGDWYDKNYPTLYEHYFSIGRSLPIHIPSRKNIIKELFAKYLGNDELRKSYLRFSQSIREFRNVVVHDVQIGKLIINGEIHIPKPRLIKKYMTWREVFSAIDKPEVIAQDFQLKRIQMELDLNELEHILNSIWDLIISEFLTEFYSQDRPFLRDRYGLVLSDD